METNHIPPLQTSTSYPMIFNPKELTPRNEAMLTSSESFVQSMNASSQSIAITGIYGQNEDRVNVRDVTERTAVEQPYHTLVPSTCNYKEEKGIFGIVTNDCHLKQIGTGFVVVKNSSVESANNLNARRKTLPGEVDSDDAARSMYDHIVQMKPASKFWDVIHCLSDLQKAKLLFTHGRHCVYQTRKFIKKLKIANIAEKSYLEKMNVNSVVLPSSDLRTSDMYDSDDSTNSAIDLESYKKTCGTLKLPKLGKVYVELQANFKVWDNLLKTWHDIRSSSFPVVLDKLLQFKRTMENQQSEMLLFTEQLIVHRLHTLASSAAFAGVGNEEEYDWLSLFGDGCLKRLCKLIETYNNMLRKVLQNSIKRRRSVLPQSSFVHGERFPSDALKDPKAEDTPSTFTASRIVDELSGPARRSLGEALLRMLDVIKRSNDFNIEEELQGASLVHLNADRFEWAKAHDADFDEDNIITSVGGHEVLDTAYVDMPNETLFTIKQLLYSQGSFIVSFMKCLAGNSSLMRNKLRSKSPRSITSQRQIDDVASVMSSDDDDVSSMASSSFFSQLSGTGPSSGRKRKTVQWRDSWDQEAVKTSSKSYMAMLIKEGPVVTLQNQICTPRSSLTCASSPCELLPPRFWTDWSSLILDASISNLMTLDLLPGDVLGSVQCSTTTFCIEKALLSWDLKMCEALAVSTADKCGSLPLKGAPSLTKTALTYVQSIQALMFIMKFCTRDDVVQKALPRLESSLDSFHQWCHKKVEDFLTSWSLRPLLQVSLGDLSQVTTIGLNCLPLIEKCHNSVESRRLENPATLQLATYHLKNIDGIITNMQSLSGECMRMYSTKCKFLAERAIRSNFPSKKLWRQKNLTDHSSPSLYMERSVQTVLVPLCSAVCVLSPRCQLTAVPPAVSALLEATVNYIVENRIRFSVQGASQLQRDVEYVSDYVCSGEARLCSEVVRAVPMLSSVKRATWAAVTLQRTDAVAETSTKGGYSVTRRGGRRRTSRVGAFTGEESDLSQDENRSLEKQLLALRIQGRNWFTSPCWDDAAC